jgi:protein-S-isoprenylcysteine O-methyltransferase Ste14
MTIDPRPIPTATFTIVMACWIAFFVALIRRGAQGRGSRRVRDRASWVGIVLQGLGFGIVWGGRGSHSSSFFGAGGAWDAGIGATAAALAIGSLVWGLAALRTLGKEWSLEARLVEGHRLVTEGPYARVRHPIYTAMLGSLLAAGLAVSDPIALAVALAPFSLGTLVRVRLEERLLREAFPDEYPAYAARVPAVLPRLG